MSDEPAKIILGDTAISAFEGTPGRRRFGRGKDTGPSLTHCENCGAELQGHWCAQCGQAAIEYRRSFRYVVADLLNEFLNWDSKFFTTIALLILKPWRLTNEFLAGKRVRYVNPLRLYLLASILFFFAVNYGAKGINFDATQIWAQRTEVRRNLESARIEEGRFATRRAGETRSIITGFFTFACSLACDERAFAYTRSHGLIGCGFSTYRERK